MNMCRFGAVLWMMLLAGNAAAQAAVSDEELQHGAAAAVALIKGTLPAAGLQAPVRVQRDRWGVAHIYAKNQHDLFFAQGFVVAQDRLFQMELWKRSGQGRLAEILGPAAVERDINARRLSRRLEGGICKLRPRHSADPRGLHLRHQRVHRCNSETGRTRDAH
jgi:acyl-homoserine lactone acylase PvdQ